MKYIITGTGRCGTCWTAKALTKLGSKCSHQWMFNQLNVNDLNMPSELIMEGYQGESSWLAAPFLAQIKKQHPNWKIIHLFREPFANIAAILRNDYDYMSLPWPNSWLADYFPHFATDGKLAVEHTIEYYINWNERILPYADLTVSTDSLSDIGINSICNLLGIRIDPSLITDDDRNSHGSKKLDPHYREQIQLVLDLNPEIKYKLDSLYGILNEKRL